MFKSFIKMLLIFISFIYVFSEQKFIIQQKYEIMQNVREGDSLPLIIYPNETVTSDEEITCQGIRMTSYTIQDNTVVLTIKAGTEAGTKFDLDCEFPTGFSNKEITFLQGEKSSLFYVDITILFVNKFAFIINEEEYNYIDKNGKFPFQVYSTQEVSDDISIEDGTFYLSCLDNSNIQLSNCEKIKKNSGKNYQNITCEVNEEIKEDKTCILLINEGKKIDGVEPFVEDIYFYFKKLDDDTPSDDSDNSSVSNNTASNTTSKNSTDSDSGEKLRISIGILMLLLLL